MLDEVTFWWHAQFGVIVLTTSNGIMDHEEARRKKVGGKVRDRLVSYLRLVQCWPLSVADPTLTTCPSDGSGSLKVGERRKPLQHERERFCLH